MKNLIIKSANVIRWIIGIIVAIIGLGMQPYGIANIFFILCALCICPLIEHIIYKRINKKNIPTKIFCILSIIFFLIGAYFMPLEPIPQSDVQDNVPIIDQNIENKEIHVNVDNTEQESNKKIEENTLEKPSYKHDENNNIIDTDKVLPEETALPILKISYIDVGQADCILIQNEKGNMIIDAGNNADGEKLVKYFKNLGIKKFDIVVGTHPHEDHIGGLDNVINSFDIGTIYMPNVLTTTATFEDVLDSIDNKGLRVTTPIVGKSFNLGECEFEILSVSNNNKDLNSCSIVLKLNYGKNTFIFSGDATNENETLMLSKNLKADVLKVRTSWSKD